MSENPIRDYERFAFRICAEVQQRGASPDRLRRSLADLQADFTERDVKLQQLRDAAIAAGQKIGHSSAVVERRLQALYKVCVKLLRWEHGAPPLTSEELRLRENAGAWTEDLAGQQLTDLVNRFRRPWEKVKALAAAYDGAVGADTDRAPSQDTARPGQPDTAGLHSQGGAMSQGPPSADDLRAGIDALVAFVKSWLGRRLTAQDVRELGELCQRAYDLVCYFGLTVADPPMTGGKPQPVFGQMKIPVKTCVFGASGWYEPELLEDSPEWFQQMDRLKATEKPTAEAEARRRKAADYAAIRSEVDRLAAAPCSNAQECHEWCRQVSECAMRVVAFHGHGWDGEYTELPPLAEAARNHAMELGVHEDRMLKLQQLFDRAVRRPPGTSQWMKAVAFRILVQMLARWCEAQLPEDERLGAGGGEAHQARARQGKGAKSKRGRKPKTDKAKARDVKLYRDWKAAHGTTGISKAEFLHERGLPETDLAAIERGRKHVARKPDPGRK
jgi:hypothetical protein